MALLDLQGMENADQLSHGGSSSSGHSCGSTLSLALCDNSGLSVLLCDPHGH